MADKIQKNGNGDGSNKNVKYLGRDFSAFKSSLLEFAKTYYPKTYKDFSDASVGMMFIEMASFVGDVLSFYTDYQFKEGLLPYAEDRKNVIALAKFLGYKPKVTKCSNAEISIYQLIPAKLVGSEYVPDPKYFLTIREFMEVGNSAGVSFITTEPVDFSINTTFSPREDSVYSRDSYGIPEFFLCKKKTKVFSGKIVTKDVVVSDATPYFKFILPETNVVEILNVVDSDSNKWYEVECLAQDVVFTEVDNSFVNDGSFYSYKSNVPKLIKSLRTPRKFVTHVTSDNHTYIEFGAGTDSFADEVIYPTADIIGVGLQNINSLNVSYDSSKLLKTDLYGQAPANTTLTITYVVGGGIDSNCPANDISKIKSIEFTNDVSVLGISEQSLMQTVQGSVKVSNENPAVGGGDAESVDEIRQNAMANFSSQNRTVTVDDYILRAYSLPSRFGTIAKVHVQPDNSSIIFNGTIDTNNLAHISSSNVRNLTYNSTNPFSLNLYVLSYDSNKNLTPINPALASNLQTYLDKYKIMTDGINIIDGYVINIGVDFKISVYKNYNKKEVLSNCIENVKKFFDIDKMNFNQPINIGELELEIAKVEGVQSVSEIKFVNLTDADGEYSSVEYNLEEATLNKILYPSLDPSVFEVKYPNNDIRGSVF